MIRSTLFAAVLVASSLLGVGSFAMAGAVSAPSEPTPIVREWDGFQAEDDGQSVEEPIVWSLVVIAAGAVITGTLYLLKRQIGAFPENPDWVAPITVMPSRENAEEEEDFPPPPADHH